jgi:hypothetical protein
MKEIPSAVAYLIINSGGKPLFLTWSISDIKNKLGCWK